LSPASLVGPASSTATVTLASAAPTGNAVVTLASSNTVFAVVPNSVVVPAGQTRATFTVNAAQVTAATAVSILATYQNVSRSATLTIDPPAPAPAQAVTLTVTATGRGGERVSSIPAGISVAVGSTGSASFATGTSITLRATNSRDVIWSGACSSAGKKTKTCRFTIGANATVTANVQ
jgi:hypothetical protein